VSKGPEYVCRWIETHCVLTSGSMAGKPLRLLGCQRDVIGGSGTDQHWILRSEDEEDAVPEDPKWSPDGRRIAFEWRGGLYTLPTNAGLRPSSFTNRLSSNSALIAGATRSPGTRASTGSPLSSAGRKRDRRTGTRSTFLRRQRFTGVGCRCDTALDWRRSGAGCQPRETVPALR
jgi:hypothetical protein